MNTAVIAFPCKVERVPNPRVGGKPRPERVETGISNNSGRSSDFVDQDKVVRETLKPPI